MQTQSGTILLLTKIYYQFQLISTSHTSCGFIVEQVALENHCFDVTIDICVRLGSLHDRSNPCRTQFDLETVQEKTLYLRSFQLLFSTLPRH